MAQPEPITFDQQYNAGSDVVDMGNVHEDYGHYVAVLQGVGANGDPGGPVLTVEIEGNRDPVVQIVAQRFAPKFRALGQGDPRRVELTMQFWREVKALKDVTENQKRPGPPPAAPPQDNPSANRDAAQTPRDEAPRPKLVPTQITFDFGELGTHRATYGHAQIVGRVLTAMNPVDDRGGSYEPPPDKHVIVSIHGYPAPLVVMLVGSYPFIGWVHTVFLIIDPNELEGI